MIRAYSTALGLATLAAFAPRHGSAQNLADRVANAPTPRVQFTFAARADVCGNGRSFIRVSSGSWYGSFNEGDSREPCSAGPVRVLLDRAGREIVSVATFVGPYPQPAEGDRVTDLGRVRPRDAADFLLSLAENADGRVSRDAIFPAVLADSVDVSPRLLGVARNQGAARETRRSAISWLGRPLDSSERNVRGIADALVSIARDAGDNQSVRQQALRTLARLEHGAGTTALITLTRESAQSWMAREALLALNSGGDPRARQHLRTVVREATFPDDVLAAAVRGLGGDYATGADVKLIRDSYPKLTGDKAREAAIGAIAAFGGSDNIRWLLALARDADQPGATRKRAIHYANRGGATVADVAKIYDENTDTQVKEAVISALAESGEQAATDKLMQIARNDISAAMRRRAINALSRSSDERVKQFLSELSVR